MKQITVACHQRDPRCFTVQKYGNVQSGLAPHGVNALRNLRRISPDPDKLTPLARFLLANCPSCVAGNLPAFSLADRVQVYSGKTVADIHRTEAKTGYVNGIFYGDKAVDRAEKIIACYDLENEEAKIEDWHFSIIKPGQTDEGYLNLEAEKIIASGGRRVVVNNCEFSVQGVDTDGL